MKFEGIEVHGGGDWAEVGATTSPMPETTKSTTAAMERTDTAPDGHLGICSYLDSIPALGPGADRADSRSPNQDRTADPEVSEPEKARFPV